MIDRRRHRPGIAWPAIVAVRPQWYGCETGCEGLEVAEIQEGDDPADINIGRRISFDFGYPADTEAEAREVWGIPPTTRVLFVPGMLTP